ncbi:hypothetical protein ACL1CN_03250 [Corynebacterium striatum]|nr:MULTISPECIES: hypothetical protein [Corynebacterium]MDK8788107.1 hypothetical protein [Corynebacterium striatum]
MSHKHSPIEGTAGNNRHAGDPAMDNPEGVTIPLAWRVGGAFSALAFVLVLLGVLAIVNDGFGAPFEWTWNVVFIVFAAILVGAFSTVRKDQKGSRTQLIALVMALIAIVAGRFMPTEPLMVTGQPLVFAYFVGALLCAFIIRRTGMTKVPPQQ